MALLDGKTAIVTGASSGIGAATAAGLAREGARVAGGARRVEQLETEIKLELDVTDRESCERFVETAVGKLGGLDILINNAGLGLGRDPFWESTEEDEDTVLETDVPSSGDYIALLREAKIALSLDGTAAASQVDSSTLLAQVRAALESDSIAVLRFECCSPFAEVESCLVDHRRRQS